jgi:phage N-6-adenine-methyltransferase
MKTMKMIDSPMMSSKTDLWSTPKEFFNNVNKQFNFTLDVCASPENAKCEKFFTKEDNGIMQKWEGVCWMNPPYGKGIGIWIEKAYLSSKLGCTVVGLLPARTDTQWFHKYILGCARIVFIKGRLKFGGSKNSAPFPSMLVVWKKGILK